MFLPYVTIFTTILTHAKMGTEPRLHNTLVAFTNFKYIQLLHSEKKISCKKQTSSLLFITKIISQLHPMILWEIKTIEKFVKTSRVRYQTRKGPQVSRSTTSFPRSTIAARKLVKPERDGQLLSPIGVLLTRSRDLRFA